MFIIKTMKESSRRDSDQSRKESDVITQPMNDKQLKPPNVSSCLVNVMSKRTIDIVRSHLWW